MEGYTGTPSSCQRMVFVYTCSRRLSSASLAWSSFSFFFRSCISKNKERRAQGRNIKTTPKTYDINCNIKQPNLGTRPWSVKRNVNSATKTKTSRFRRQRRQSGTRSSGYTSGILITHTNLTIIISLAPTTTFFRIKEELHGDSDTKRKTTKRRNQET